MYLIDILMLKKDKRKTISLQKTGYFYMQMIDDDEWLEELRNGGIKGNSSPSFIFV